MFDLLHQQYGRTIEGPSHINGSERIDFIFVTAKLLLYIKVSGFTAFNDLKNLDHKGLYIYTLHEGIMKRLKTNLKSPFKRKIQSNNLQAIRKYKNHLK